MNGQHRLHLQVSGSCMICDRSTVLLATCLTCSSLVLGTMRNFKLQPEQAFADSSINVAALEIALKQQEGNRLPLQLVSQTKPSPEPLSTDSRQTPKPAKVTKSRRGFRKPPLWFLALVGTFAIAGGGIFVVLKWLGSTHKAIEPKSPPSTDDVSTIVVPDNGAVSQTPLPDFDAQTTSYSPSAVTVSLPNSLDTQPIPQPSSGNVPVKNTTRLSAISIVDELIKDLREPNPQKRRKAIWQLAQKGDSRAVQPLVDLLIDSDSQQRSLILEALAQIGTKTLKPLNRALAISLQDDNAQVRKNAIRDLTRIYEIVAQTSQILCNAADDPDPEVRETAQWAMSQLNRIRTLTTLDNLPSSPSTILTENNHDREHQ
ncbi:MAG TPA: HEAT repeat domain-containing protein [Allocoleopsis sp.]